MVASSGSQDDDATLAQGAEPDRGVAIVAVPLNHKPLGPVPAERVRRLREHLVRSLRGLRTLKYPQRNASPLRPEPEGFAGAVARAACGLCKGWCCKGGGEHGYLDEWTMARVRLARPELEARAVIRLYVESVPAEGYQGSCVFHGPAGCTLDRSLRADVCNSYFCSGLGHFVKAPDGAARAEVTAGDAGDPGRVSLVMTR